MPFGRWSRCLKNPPSWTVATKFREEPTFPSEYRKIRSMVSVRDQYLWDLAAGRKVASEPDDSKTGEVFEPETMFGSRDENFRKGREPEKVVYPTPEESISMMTVPDGFRVEMFASEREFPELANPNQIAFDARGRLWVSCMPNYPQWQPGAKRPDDRLLILEDTNGDGRADKCTTFYDKLICPTGFEFFNGGVLVVDEPRILFLKDTDGDDRADEAIQLIDGIATDDTHHTVGAWEYSHGGQLHMLEGISLSTTLETPWGAFRNRNTGGGYVYDPVSMKLRHYITPGYGNPWCLVFDPWGNGIVGDGTNAKQHWVSPLSGKEVTTRKTLEPVFDNEGMRPAVGNEFLISRHLPDDMQGQFIYACVINMHGMPRFNLRDQPGTAGFEGERIEDLLSSTDMTFRPVDPKIGPDGAIWFGDWCNALIGHMQYSQRDPNRDHIHGRVYRMVHTEKPLLEKLDFESASVDQLVEYLTIPELRTRYRLRRELRERPKAVVNHPMDYWIDYTLEHTLYALEPQWSAQKGEATFLASSTEKAQKHFTRFMQMAGPGGAAVLPLEMANNVDASENERAAAVKTLASLRGGNVARGEAVFKQVCSACHLVGSLGKKFGPDLTDVGSRFSHEKIIESIVMPNEEISKGYETVLLLTYDGATQNGFILKEDDKSITLGIANGKEVTIDKEEIEIRKEMKASSMPEGLVKTIAPIEFLDLVAYLIEQKDIRRVEKKGWVSTQYRTPPPLRMHQGAREVPQDAAIRLGDNFPRSEWNENSHLLLSPIDSGSFDFRFHSAEGVSDPFITIRLSELKTLKHLWLRNRLSSSFHARAEGLTVWVSRDGETFAKVWESKKPHAKWMIDFPAGTRARYIRIGLVGEGTFHLHQAVLYGE